MTGDRDFELLAELVSPEVGPARAGSRLKSKVFSALNVAQAREGGLRGLEETKCDGRELCVFEELVRIAPVGEAAKELNYCRVCHARVAGERWENAPIYWSGCPYVGFQNR